MQFPYKPQAVFNKMGGQVIEITGVGHKTDRPQMGYSRDYWFYTGSVRWDDNGKISTGHIEPAALCADTKEGHDEINALSALMMEYLHKNGKWNNEGPHQGWYAHRKAKLGPVYDSTGRLMASVGPQC